MDLKLTTNPSISFDLDFQALILVLIFGVVMFYGWKWRKQWEEPSLQFSWTKGLETNSQRVHYLFLPSLFIWASLIFFTLAFINPQFFIENHPSSDMTPQQIPKEGIAIYLVLDQSGSMKDNIIVQSISDGLYSTPKIDLLRKLSISFIAGDKKSGLEGRQNDLIGLIFFARGAVVKSPLTLDHQVLLKELQTFNSVGEMNLDGTSIGYAIYKAAHLIVSTSHYAEKKVQEKPGYQIKSRVIILLTDGLQDPNPLDKGQRLRNIDVPEAAIYLKEQGIRLYIVNVDPELATEKYLPYQHMMQRAAALTGGDFFMVSTSTGLEEIYKKIDQLEKSVLPDTSQNKHLRPDLYKVISLSPYLILFGLIFILIAIFLKTCILRKVP